MARTHYRNGDEITLPSGCDGCSPTSINGVLCHETGCPEAWRDTAYECFECGCTYYPTDGKPFRGSLCDDCIEVGLDEDEELLNTPEEDE